MGRNRPAEAMPFDGMVRRYLIIYSINLLLLTNECQQRGSTDYALGVAHNTSHILQLFPRSLQLHIGMCSRRSSNGLNISANARFHPSCCSTKLHLQFLRAIPLFTFTHDSLVMSTICQDFLQLYRLLSTFSTVDHVKNAQSCVNRVNTLRGTYGGTYEKRSCFSPGLLDPKSLILIWDKGVSYGLTPFQSDLIDYVKCEIPVRDVT